MAQGFDQGETEDPMDQYLRMIISEGSPQGVPHMKFQILVKATNTNIRTRISRRLWQEAGLVIRKMDTEMARFCCALGDSPIFRYLLCA